jgi:hypothetical protein
MQPLWRDLLWIYTGLGKPPDHLEIHFSWQARAAAALVGIVWAIVTAAGIIVGSLALVLHNVPEFAMRCPVGRMGVLFLLLAGSPLLAVPRVGLEMTKTAGSGVSIARLCVIAAFAAWWTLTALVGLFIFFPADNVLRILPH